ncbi:MAG: flagellin, partial [bacterium]
GNGDSMIMSYAPARRLYWFTQARSNAQDGLSMLQTAEGGMKKISDYVQRIRELAVQAANDSLTDSDRKLLQEEVDELKSEIDRQADTVQFNNKKLLNGGSTTTSSETIDFQGVTQSDSVPNAFIDFDSDPANDGRDGGTEFSDSDYQDIASNDTSHVEDLGLDPDTSIHRFEFEPDADVKDIKELTFNHRGGAHSRDSFGFEAAEDIQFQMWDNDAGQWVDIGENTSNTGEDAGDHTQTSHTVTNNPERFFDSNGRVKVQAFVKQPTTYSNRIIATDFASMDVEASSGSNFKFHVGANRDETIEVAPPDISTTTLGISATSVTSQSSAEQAIQDTKEALNTVSTERATLGAKQNRLEGAIDFLGKQRENTQASESRIRDADVAEEATKQTRSQILAQASTAVLGQIQQSSQLVTRLL